MRIKSNYPSLYICTNTHNAIWYRVEYHCIQKIHEHKESQGTYSDNEGFFLTSGRSGTTVRAGAPSHDNWNWQEETKHHLRYVAEQTANIWHNGDYRHLIISLPETEKNLFSSFLQQQLPLVSTVYRYENVTNMSPQAHRQIVNDALHS